MNHDYAHCVDFQDDCPRECFRAELVRKLHRRPDLVRMPVSWMHFKGTEECKRMKDDGKKNGHEKNTGKWIKPNNQVAVAQDEWICSSCHYLVLHRHKFCPNCGKKMERGDAT